VAAERGGSGLGLAFGTQDRTDIEAMNLHPIFALVVPLLLPACHEQKRRRPSTEDTAPTHDTGPVPDTESGCDTGHLDDDGECVPAACGTGRWGSLDTDEGTVYVDIAAAENGDGSEAAPFTSIQEGLDAAGDVDGGMVAVAAGSYPETLELGRGHDGIRLAGRCSELVIIDASVGSGNTPGIDVSLSSSEVEVSGVTVGGSRYVGVWFGSGTMTIRDSLVVGSEDAGVVAIQAGINATALTMEGCQVRGNTSVGVVAYDSGTSVILQETAIEDTQPDENGETGYGAEVWGGASLVAEACAFRRNIAVGVLADDSGTSVILRETAIEDTQPIESGEDGVGLEVYDGASLDAEGCEVRGNSAVGLLAHVSDTSVSLQETAIEDTRPDVNGRYGYGIEVWGGTSLAMEACEVAGNTGIGLLAYDSGTTVALYESVIEDTQPNERADGGHGIQVSEGASLHAEACQVRGSAGTGVAAGHSGTTVTLLETAIEDTRPIENAEAGNGIQVSEGATLDAEACQVRGNENVGIAVFDSGTTVVLQETAIEDTQPDQYGEGGYGAQAAGGARLDVEACEVRGNSAAGVIAFDHGTSIILQDTKIASTLRGEIHTVGLGVVAQESASVVATGVEVSSNEGPAIMCAAEDARFSCSGCTLSDNEFAGALIVSYGSLALDESVIEGTSSSENLGGGVGIFGAPWPDGPATLSVTDTTIRDNAVAGAWLSGEGSYSFSGNTIHGGEGWTRESLTKCGDAVYAREGVAAWDGSSGLLLEDNELLDGLGAGLFLDDASALLSGNHYADNAVDLVTQGADCESPPDGYEGEALGHAELCPAYDYATCGDEFTLYLTLEELESGYGSAFSSPVPHCPEALHPPAQPITLLRAARALPLVPPRLRPPVQRHRQHFRRGPQADPR